MGLRISRGQKALNWVGINEPEIYQDDEIIKQKLKGYVFHLKDPSHLLVIRRGKQIAYIGYFDILAIQGVAAKFENESSDMGFDPFLGHAPNDF